MTTCLQPIIANVRERYPAVTWMEHVSDSQYVPK